MADRSIPSGQAPPTASPDRTAPTRSAKWRAWGPSLFLFLLALGTRLLHLGRSPHRDELFHVLAAQSLLADGTLVIDDGGVPYTRARPFTYLIAGLFRVFGESLIVARLPGVLAMAAVVAILFWWVRSAVGEKAAWAAALLLCFDPAAVFYSQLGRFYGLHALLFFLGALGIYHATRERMPRSGAIAAGGLGTLSLALACSIQLTTALGAAALLPWLALAKGPELARRVPGRRRRPVAAGIALALAGLLVILFVSGAAEYLWDRYGYADVWAVGRAWDPLFYHRELAIGYPTLWSVFPVILLAALATAPRIAGFSAVLFCGVFLLLSFGAQKHERYLLFAMPFFFMLCGIALGKAIPWLGRRLERVLRRWERLDARSRATKVLVSASLVGMLVFALGSNRAPVSTVRMLATSDPDDRVYGWQPAWIAAAPTLRPLAESTTLVLGSWPLATWYYLDRLDVSLHARELRTPRPLPEFAVPAWYLPRPTVSEPESLRRLVECAPSGLVIVERGHWGTPWIVSADMTDFIATHLERVPLPERWGLLVYRWNGSSGRTSEPCRDILGNGSRTRS